MRLFHLEWKKINKRPYLYAIMGMATFSLFVAMLFMLMPKEEMELSQIDPVWGNITTLVSCVTFAEFAVFGAVLNARTVLEDYIGKQVLLLFSYPIRREELIRTKMAITWGLTAGGALITNLAAMLAAAVVSFIFRPLETGFGVNEALAVLLYSAGMAVMAGNIALISLWFGFWKSSVVTEIVSSLIIIIPLANMLSASLFSSGLQGALFLLAAVGVTLAVSAVITMKIIHRVKNMEVK